jgi:signal transduction histidine kinase
VKKLWYKVSYLGTAEVIEPAELQSLVLTNRINIIAVGVLFILGILLGSNQWNAESYFIMSLSPLFLIFPLLMYLGRVNLARLTLCLFLPVVVIGISIVSKLIPNELITETEYFDYRYVLLATSLIPPILFGFSKKRYLALSLSIYLLAFIFFDDIHNWLGVGYFQVHPTFQHPASYNVSRWVAVIVFCGVSIGVLAMRKTSDETQLKNKQLIQELNLLNKELDNQKSEIKKANELLSNKVAQATADLLDSNTELIKHNNELQQFSYTVSHNLRGPVASLLGLVSVAKTSEPDLMANPLFLHITKSAKSLDATIKDLGRIVDIRNSIYKIRQKIEFDQLLQEVIEPMLRDVEEKGIEVVSDFKASAIYTVKPMLTSILYNLVSNGIKYISPERKPTIHISTFEDEETVTLKVKDNGLGIDLKNQADNLFKLYKRFHFHTEGKGIGLYLVKMQVESLGGKITAISEVNSFMEFTIVLPKPKNVNHQFLLNEPFGEVFYDATMNVMGIRWHRAVNSTEYRKVLDRALEFMKEQKSPNWLLDLSKRGAISAEDQAWVLTDVLPTTFKLGLKRLAVVSEEELNVASHQFLEKNATVLEKYGIKVVVFKSAYEAELWLAQERIISNGTNQTMGHGASSMAQ